MTLLKPASPTFPAQSDQAGRFFKSSGGGREECGYYNNRNTNRRKVEETVRVFHIPRAACGDLASFRHRIIHQILCHPHPHNTHKVINVHSLPRWRTGQSARRVSHNPGMLCRGRYGSGLGVVDVATSKHRCCWTIKLDCQTGLSICRGTTSRSQPIRIHKEQSDLLVL